MSDDILDVTRQYFTEHDPDWDTRRLIVGLAAEVEKLRKRENRVRSLAEYWTSNDPADPRLPQGLRQGGQTLLGALDSEVTS